MDVLAFQNEMKRLFSELENETWTDDWIKLSRSEFNEKYIKSMKKPVKHSIPTQSEINSIAASLREPKSEDVLTELTNHTENQVLIDGVTHELESIKSGDGTSGVVLIRTALLESVFNAQIALKKKQISSYTPDNWEPTTVDIYVTLAGFLMGLVKMAGAFTLMVGTKAVLATILTILVIKALRRWGKDEITKARLRKNLSEMISLRNQLNDEILEYTA